MKPPLEVLQEIAMCSDILREYFATLHKEVARLKPPSSDVFVKPKSLRSVNLVGRQYFR